MEGKKEELGVSVGERLDVKERHREDGELVPAQIADALSQLKARDGKSPDGAIFLFEGGEVEIAGSVNLDGGHCDCCHQFKRVISVWPLRLAQKMVG